MLIFADWDLFGGKQAMRTSHYMPAAIVGSLLVAGCVAGSPAQPGATPSAAASVAGMTRAEVAQCIDVAPGLLGIGSGAEESSDTVDDYSISLSSSLPSQ